MNIVDINKALELLQNGEVVAIPTETVYGLAGWINSEEGIKKIFSTKERPFFDPLIVHIDSISKAKLLTTDWTIVHEALAKAAWPGPLTLIAKKTDSLNPLITSGLDSVGLRCPNHPETLKLLAKIDGGLAAPSANKFGKTSPTSSKHVFEEFGEEVAIIEGGNCEVGIESTVAGVIREGDKFKVEIYRPGFYTASMLQEILKNANIVAEVIYAQSPVAPGQLKHHYMPKIPLAIVPNSFNWEKDHQQIEKQLERSFTAPVHWHQPQSANLASRELYQKMREFDQEGYDLILAYRDEKQDTEEWLGIWNRLSKAKSLAL